MDFTTTKFWLHPITMSVMIAGTLLFVVLVGNIELLWIPAVAALGAAIGSDWSRAARSRACACGLPEVNSSAPAIRPEVPEPHSPSASGALRREQKAA